MDSTQAGQGHYGPQIDSNAHQTWLRGNVRVGQRPMLEVLRVLKLEPQRPLIVTLEQSDKQGER